MVSQILYLMSVAEERSATLTAAANVLRFNPDIVRQGKMESAHV